MFMWEISACLHPFAFCFGPKRNKSRMGIDYRVIPHPYLHMNNVNLRPRLGGEAWDLEVYSFLSFEFESLRCKIFLGQ